MKQLLSAEAENEITVCAFRLLTMDLLVLYGVMNEGTINVLGILQLLLLTPMISFDRMPHRALF